MPAISAIVDLKGLGYRQLYMPAVFHLTGLLTLVERNYPSVSFEFFFHLALAYPALLTARASPHADRTRRAGNAWDSCVSSTRRRSCTLLVDLVPAAVRTHAVLMRVRDAAVRGVERCSTTFWAIIKPFIPERSQQRIRILGNDYLTDVLELIPPENLPVRGYGQIRGGARVRTRVRAQAWV